jgi:hypothetical protein
MAIGSSIRAPPPVRISTSIEGAISRTEILMRRDLDHR